MELVSPDLKVGPALSQVRRSFFSLLKVSLDALDPWVFLLLRGVVCFPPLGKFSVFLDPLNDGSSDRIRSSCVCVVVGGDKSGQGGLLCIFRDDEG